MAHLNFQDPENPGSYGPPALPLLLKGALDNTRVPHSLLPAGGYLEDLSLIGDQLNALYPTQGAWNSAIGTSPGDVYAKIKEVLKNNIARLAPFDRDFLSTVLGAP